MASTDDDRSSRRQVRPSRPVIFLDIDGVLNTTMHNTQIRVDRDLVSRLDDIVRRTDASIVYTTFWRHFHEYISYVLHRHGIDVGRHVLPYPACITGGKQSTRTFLRFHRMRTTTREEDDGPPGAGRGGKGGGKLGQSLECATSDENSDGCMVGRSAEDEREYSSRADEIEAWLMNYGTRYLGSAHDGNGGLPGDDDVCASRRTDDDDIIGSKYCMGYDYHPADWKYVILDDRPCAARPNTPMMERFVRTDARVGLTEADVERAVGLLLYGPDDVRSAATAAARGMPSSGG